MPIAELNPISIAWPSAHSSSGIAPDCANTQLNLYLIQVNTDEDMCGWGETRLTQESNFLPIAEMLGDLIIGEDPLNRGILWDRLLNMVEAEAVPGGSSDFLHDLYAVLSAIDIALWDLMGRKLGVSVARLLGGVRSSRLDVCISGLCGDSPRDLANQAQHVVADGFRAIKIKLAGELQEDVAMVAAVREVLGNQVVLMADADEAYKCLDSARKLGVALSKHDVYWLEDAFAAGRWDEYSQLAASIEPPLAGGKTLYRLTELLEPIQREALHVVVPDLRVCGGITAAWFIGTLGQLHGVRMSVHSGQSPLTLLAAANLSAAMPYAERLQLTDWQAALAQAMMSHPPHYEQGFFIFNDRPGLGSDIRSDFVETYGRSIANQ